MRRPRARRTPSPPATAWPMALLPSEHAAWVADYEKHEQPFGAASFPPRRTTNERTTTMAWSDTGGKEFEQPPEGPTVGRCVRIIDLGTQDESFEGKKKKQRKVM